MGRIYMIIGKSASGKDHIYPKLLEDGSLEYHFYEGRTERWQKI